MQNLYIGIEIGGTKQQVALGTAEGQLLDKITGKIQLKRGAPDILEWLEEKVPLLLAKEAEFSGTIKGIAAGFGGPLESKTGRIISSIQVPGWENFELRSWLTEKFHLPSIVINDTVCGGFAELYLGSGRDAQNLFYTNIGSGIGGAMFVARQYYDGTGTGASYLGNSYIPDWTSAAPGTPIKVENICSGMNIEHRIRMPGYVPASSKLMELCGGDPQALNCQMLAAAAEAGDNFAAAEIDRIAYSYSIGLCNVLALVSPEKIVIGGGVAKMGPVLLDPIRKHTSEMAFVSCKNRYVIEQSQLLDDAVIAGAVICAGKQTT